MYLPFFTSTTLRHALRVVGVAFAVLILARCSKEPPRPEAITPVTAPQNPSMATIRTTACPGEDKARWTHCYHQETHTEHRIYLGVVAQEDEKLFLIDLSYNKFQLVFDANEETTAEPEPAALVDGNADTDSNAPVDANSDSNDVSGDSNDVSSDGNDVSSDGNSTNDPNSSEPQVVFGTHFIATDKATLDTVVGQGVKIYATSIVRTFYFDSPQKKMQEAEIIMPSAKLILSDLSDDPFSCSLKYPQSCDLKTVVESETTANIFGRITFDIINEKIFVAYAAASGEKSKIYVLDRKLEAQFLPHMNALIHCKMTFKTTYSSETGSNDAPLFKTPSVVQCEPKLIGDLKSFPQSCQERGTCKQATIKSSEAFSARGTLRYLYSNSDARLILETDADTYYLGAETYLSYLGFVDQEVLVAGNVKVYEIISPSDESYAEKVLFIDTLEPMISAGTITYVDLTAAEENGDKIFKKGSSRYSFHFDYTSSFSIFDVEKSFINGQVNGQQLQTIGIVGDYFTVGSTITKKIYPLAISSADPDSNEIVFPYRNRADETKTNLPLFNDEITVINIFSTIKTGEFNFDAPDDDYSIQATTYNRTTYPYVEVVHETKRIRIVLLDNGTADYADSILHSDANSADIFHVAGVIANKEGLPEKFTDYELWVAYIYYVAKDPKKRSCGRIPASVLCFNNTEE